MNLFQKLINKAHHSTLITQSSQLQQHLQILTLPIEALENFTQKMLEENLAVEEFIPLKSFQPPCNADSPAPYQNPLFEHIPLQLSRSFDQQIAKQILASISPEGFLDEKERVDLKNCYGPPFDEVLALIQKTTQLGFEDRLEFWKHLLKQQGDAQRCLDLITHHKQELLQGDFKTLIKITQSTPTTFKTLYLDRLKKLPLAPYQGHLSQHPVAPIDIIIQKQEECLDFEIKNPLPSFTLNALVHSNTPHIKEFYKPFLDQLQCVITGIKKRGSTLEKLTKKLLVLQKDYLQGESATPQPLDPKKLAHQLGIHPSTLARAVQNKTLLCPQGVIHLKSLITPSSVDGDKTTILFQIKSLIAQENRKSPYSDQKLLEILKTKGSKLSRRTLTKYRHQLKIPDARRRFLT